jgi:hypothetical protein
MFPTSVRNLLAPLAVAVTVAAAPVAARAEASIATDRPGLAFSPRVVTPGAVQVELGAPRLDDAGPGAEAAVAMDGAIRAGVADRIEARVSSTWFGRTPGAGGADGPTGVAGLRLGLKVAALDGSRVALALIPEVVLPVGDDDLAGDRAAYSMNVAAGMPVGSAGLVLVAGAQANPVGEDDHETTGALVAVLGRGLTGSLSGYVEAGAYPGPGEDAAYAGLGAAWLPGPLVQLDAFADFGLNDASSDAVLGLGLSFLIPGGE